MVRYAKGLGFTLGEIASFIDDWMCNGITDTAKVAALKEKLVAVEAQQHDLEQVRCALKVSIAASI